MTTKTHELRLAIDAGAAQTGAKQFTAAIESVKRAVAGLEKDTQGAFTSLSKANTGGLKEITAEARKTSSGLAQVESASDRAAANIQRTALASAMALRQATTSAQKLGFRLGDLGDASGLAQLEAGLARLRASLLDVQTPMDVRVARSAYEDLRTGLTQTATAAEYARGDLAQLAREQAEAARGAAQHEAALSALRAEFNPLYSASKQYEATLDRIAMAEREGVISSALAAQARDRAAATLGGFDHIGKSAKNMGWQVQNASYQIGDFFVQIAAGTDATRALSMQLPQLLGGFGVWGAAAGAVAAIMGALVPLLMTGGEKAKTFDDVMSNLNTTLNTYRDSAAAVNGGTLALREEFGMAADSAQRFHAAMAAVATMKMEQQLQDGVAALGVTMSGVTGLMDQWDKASFLPSALRAETILLAADAAEQLQIKFGLSVNQAHALTESLNAARMAKGPQETSAALQRVVAQLLAARDAGAKLPPELVKAVEEAATLGLNADRLSAILAPVPGMIGQATGQTNSWANAMAGVKAEISAIMSQLASISGGAIGIAAKNAELAVLQKGGSIRDGEIARLRHENEARLAARENAAGDGVGGWINRGLIQVERNQFERGLVLDDQISAAREEARKRDSSSGGSAARTEAIGDERKSLAALSRDVNKRIFEAEQESDALAILASGQVDSIEAARMWADAQKLMNGTIDSNTAGLIQQYEATLQLNAELERQATAQQALRQYVNDLPGALESIGYLKRDLAEAFNGGLSDAFMGEFDAKKIVDSLRRKFADALAAQTTKMLFPFLAGDDNGVKSGATAAAPVLAGGIVAGATQAAGILSAAMTGASVPTTGATAGMGGGFFGLIGKIFGFAEGGYSDGPGMSTHFVSPAAFHHAPQFAQGTPNTSGIPAILHPNEAVVPLSKGRKIPVDASGLETGATTTARFGDVNVSTTVNVDGGGDANDPKQAAAMAKTIGDSVRMAVQVELAAAAAYGGSLNPRGNR